MVWSEWGRLDGEEILDPKAHTMAIFQLVDVLALESWDKVIVVENLGVGSMLKEK